MKVNMIKNAGGLLSPADEEAEEYMRNLKNGEHYSLDIKLDQNWRLHKKIFGFFKFCTQHYFGDLEPDKEQRDYTRKQLLIAAGFTKTMVDPRTGHIEITAKSLKYASMPPEERSACYKSLIDAALRNVFHDANSNTLDQVVSWF